ncbi:uncharacterized protein LOC122296725 [Carya illinoinensis]|uniref:Uncharacterized protein n=1 Tax=Carya illinoinensis TaxID=32201 RepID=A0A8T1N597_CARIL|nr:uncharacterized protein LOC122296725 [Carya illinoinensis]KAG6626866.1 hypothetical protein CIPAW_15G082200 [Carya illinoinensis]KAG6675024.1 hypothetical protein I3842_15G078500 [Carya illinoinensis]
MATEDFSFPIIGNAFLCSISSPQLWQLSGAASLDSCSHEEYEEDCAFAPEPIMNSQRVSFSYAEDGGKEVLNDGKDDDDDDDDNNEEEKMDMLWEEYFNEELSRTPTSRSNTFSSRDMVELGSVKPLTRKPGRLLIMKVLKKLLLLHKNSHGKLKMTRN